MAGVTSSTSVRSAGVLRRLLGSASVPLSISLPRLPFAHCSTTQTPQGYHRISNPVSLPYIGILLYCSRALSSCTVSGIPSRPVPSMNLRRQYSLNIAFLYKEGQWEPVAGLQSNHVLLPGLRYELRHIRSFNRCEMPYHILNEHRLWDCSFFVRYPSRDGCDNVYTSRKVQLSACNQPETTVSLSIVMKP